MKKGKLGFIADGIVNESKFGKYPGSKLRILWILKEVNAKDPTESWDLTEFLRFRKEKDDGLFNYVRWKTTYGLVVKVGWGLLNRLSKFELIPKDLKKAAEILDYVAVININKKPGSKRATWSRIKKSFLDLENQKFLVKQIETINPNIIIGGNTLWLFYKNNIILKKSDFDGKKWGHFRNGILWIDAYHPNQTKIKHKQYYEEIWKMYVRHKKNLK